MQPASSNPRRPAVRRPPWRTRRRRRPEFAGFSACSPALRGAFSAVGYRPSGRPGRLRRGGWRSSGRRPDVTGPAGRRGGRRRGGCRRGGGGGWGRRRGGIGRWARCRKGRAGHHGRGRVRTSRHWASPRTRGHGDDAESDDVDGRWPNDQTPPISSPITPPNTQDSCSAVSLRPNAEARLTSGQVPLDHRVEAHLGQRRRRRADQSDDRGGGQTRRQHRDQVRRRSPRTSEMIDIVSGWVSGSRAPRALPTNPPMPAATPTTPSSSSCVNPLDIGVLALDHERDEQRQEAGLDPDRAVGPQRGGRPISGRRRAWPVGRPGRRRPGPRRRSTPPRPGCAGTARRRRRRCSAVKTSAPGEPNAQARPAAMAPATPPAISPNTVSREFVLTRVISSGSTRGVSAALSTPNDLDSTSMPSAHGIQHPGVELERHDHRQHRPGEARGGQREPPAALQPVQQRADQRCDHRERAPP